MDFNTTKPTAFKQWSALSQKEKKPFSIYISKRYGGITVYHLQKWSTEALKVTGGVPEEFQSALNLVTMPELPDWLLFVYPRIWGNKFPAYMLLSPVRDFLYLVLDFFLGKPSRAFMLICGKIKSCKALKWYYGDDVKEDPYFGISGLLDRLDTLCIPWEAAIFRHIRDFAFKIYKVLAIIFVGPFLLLIRLLLPAKYSMKGLLDAIFKRSTLNFKRVTFFDYPELQVRQEDLPDYVAIQSTDAFLGAAALSVADGLLNPGTLPITYLQSHVLTADLIGIYFEHKQHEWRIPEKMDKMFKNEKYFGDEPQGFPWLTYGASVFYLDVIFVSLSLGVLFLIFWILIKHNNECMYWDFTKFDIYEDMKLRFNGSTFVESSFNSFFVNDICAGIHPSVLKTFNGTAEISRHTLSHFLDFEEVSTDELHHI